MLHKMSSMGTPKFEAPLLFCRYNRLQNVIRSLNMKSIIEPGDILTERIEKASVLGCRVDIVNMKEALEVIKELINRREPGQIITLNAEIIQRAQKEPALKDVFDKARLVTPDGIGVVWALRRQGYPVKQRVTGIGLTERIIDLATEHGWRLFFLGGKPGVADQAAKRLRESRPNLQVVGTHHGYFADGEEEQIIESIRGTAPDILLVGLGAPKQEYWIARHLERVNVPVCIGVGGSLDVLSGKVQRAPDCWQRLGLEWLYRLVQEPKRIKRQMALPVFALRVLLNTSQRSRQKMQNRRG